MKALFGLGAGVSLGYYLASGRYIWEDYRISFNIRVAKKGKNG
jgi:hypothetical protein